MRSSTRCSRPTGPTPTPSTGSRSASTPSRPWPPGGVDAATAFWNAEGVALRRQGIPTRAFRVDDYGAPRYPELVLGHLRELIETDPTWSASMAGATDAAIASPSPTTAPDRGSGTSLSDLLAATPASTERRSNSQLDALMAAHAFEPPGRFDAEGARAWARWDVAHGILDSRPDLPPGRPSSLR